MILTKKLDTIKTQIAERQKNLAMQKHSVKADIHKIKNKSREQLSQPSTLLISFCSGLCLGLLGKKSTLRPVANEVVATSLSMVRKLVIVPLIGQFLVKNFRHSARKKV